MYIKKKNCKSEILWFVDLFILFLIQNILEIFYSVPLAKHPCSTFSPYIVVKTNKKHYSKSTKIILNIQNGGKSILWKKS